MLFVCLNYGNHFIIFSRNISYHATIIVLFLRVPPDTYDYIFFTIMYIFPRTPLNLVSLFSSWRVWEQLSVIYLGLSCCPGQIRLDLRLGVILCQSRKYLWALLSSTCCSSLGHSDTELIQNSKKLTLLRTYEPTFFQFLCTYLIHSDVFCLMQAQLPTHI